jgi:predicted dehydrogenase
MPSGRVLSIGVVGLGRQWRERYRPALAALPDHYRIAAVADQVQELARREARQLQCGETGGVVPMLEAPEIDAILLADIQWHGMWAVAQAAAAGKPVFSGVPPLAKADEDLRADGRVMMDLPLRSLPAARFLRALCSKKLGEPRRLSCHAETPATDDAAPDLTALAPLDLCAAFFADEPERVQSMTSANGSLTLLLLDFPGGATAAVTIARGSSARAACQLRVTCERGTAAASLAGQVRWSQRGSWSRRLPAVSDPSRFMLRRFHAAVTGDQPFAPTLPDAVRAWRWLRAAQQPR